MTTLREWKKQAIALARLGRRRRRKFSKGSESSQDDQLISANPTEVSDANPTGGVTTDTCCSASLGLELQVAAKRLECARQATQKALKEWIKALRDFKHGSPEENIAWWNYKQAEKGLDRCEELYGEAAKNAGEKIEVSPEWKEIGRSLTLGVPKKHE